MLFVILSTQSFLFDMCFDSFHLPEGDRAAQLAKQMEINGGATMDRSIIRILREHRELTESIEE